METSRPIGPLAAIRTTPELIVWGLVVFLAGVVLLPMIHLMDHRGDDHVHLLAHLSGEAHDHGYGEGHGHGALEHFGVAWLDVEPVSVPAPVAALTPTTLHQPRSAVVERFELHPIRSQAP